jgi:hypothetical protein
MVKFIAVIVLFVGAIACDSSVDPEVDLYPVRTSLVGEYKVEETIYAAGVAPVHRTWYLREVIGDSIGSAQGAPIYQVERYRKEKMEDSWRIDSVWTLYRQADKIVKFENNIPFIKLVLPPRDGQVWNGNALNPWSSQSYRLEKLDGEKYQVIQAADSSLVHMNKSIEHYEAGKGMVFKEVRRYSYCQSTPSCIGNFEIESGRDLVMKRLP